MPIDDGDQFEAIFTAMGTVAPFFEYLRILSDFLVGHGLAPADAQQIVATTFTGLLESLQAHEKPDFAEMVKEHAPPGGGNDQLTRLMREAGVFDAHGAGRRRGPPAADRRRFVTTGRAAYGVLGVGSIARAIVIGLCDGVPDPPRIVLSPRGAAVSAELAGRYPTVTVATDNQAVVDGSDVVLVCLRRADAGLLGDLTWRPEQVVVSAVPASASRSSPSGWRR